jgi:hypothetical protein
MIGGSPRLRARYVIKNGYAEVDLDSRSEAMVVVDGRLAG